MRITAACPAALVDDANQYAMCLGQSEADGQTYNSLNWQDAKGNLYAAASFDASPEWIGAAMQPLQRPSWDTSDIIDMDAANRAQQALIFWSNGQGDAPKASTTNLVAIAGVDGVEALSLMGLTTKSE